MNEDFEKEWNKPNEIRKASETTSEVMVEKIKLIFTFVVISTIILYITASIFMYIISFSPILAGLIFLFFFSYTIKKHLKNYLIDRLGLKHIKKE